MAIQDNRASGRVVTKKRREAADPSVAVLQAISTVFDSYRAARREADSATPRSLTTGGAVASYVAQSSRRILDEAVARHKLPPEGVAPFRLEQEAFARLDMFESARRRGIAVLTALGVTAAGCVAFAFAAASTVFQAGQTLIAQGGFGMLLIIFGVTLKTMWEGWEQNGKGSAAEQILKRTVYPAEKAAFAVVGGSAPIITWGRALWLSDLFIAPLIGLVLNLFLWAALYAWSGSFRPELQTPSL